jgi:cytochrome c-type biogenesis protein
VDLDALKSALEQATIGSLAVGFSTGFLFSFNPVALAAIPVSLAYVTKARETRVAVLYAGTFVLGMLAVHTVLGLIAGFGGKWVQSLFGRGWGLVLGPWLIVLGLAWPGWIRLPLPRIALRARRATSVTGAAALGATFSVAVCPFCTPALIVLLGVAAGIGSPLFGALLLFAFAAGRAVPVLLGGWAIGALESLKFLARYQRWFEVGGAVLLIAAGLYMLNAYFIVIPELAV